MRRYLLSLLRLALRPDIEALERRVLAMEGLWTLYKPLLDRDVGRAPLTSTALADFDRALAAFLDVDHRGRPLP